MGAAPSLGFLLDAAVAVVADVFALGLGAPLLLWLLLFAVLFGAGAALGMEAACESPKRPGAKEVMAAAAFAGD